MRVLERPFDHFAPPEGRVTVDLLDERGLKIVHRARGENAILNHWQENVKRMVRGDENFISSAPGSYVLHGGGVVLNSNTDVNSAEGGAALSWWLAGVQRGNPLWAFTLYNGLQASYRSIILSDSLEAVDADEFFFPGNVNAFCYMPEVYAPSTNTKRAQLVSALCQRTPTLLRYVSEWGTAYGNGLHNSVGIGHCTFPASTGQAFAMPSLYANYPTFAPGDTSQPAAIAGTWRTNNSQAHPTFGVNTPPITSDVPVLSGHWVSNSEIWVLVAGTAANNLTKMDLSACTTRPFSVAAAGAGVVVTGPTMTTIGSGTARTGVAVIGADLWLAYGTTLKRCVKPTTTALTVTNTYTPAGVGTLVDLTTDGTSLYWLDATKVWIIDPATGNTTGSWNHGLTGTMHNICYLARPTSKPRLWISYLATGLTAAVWNSAAGPTARQPVVADSFTVAGVREPGVSYCPTLYGGGSISYVSSGLVIPLVTDCKHSYGWWGYSNTSGFSTAAILGPSHMSRTVLGSPVTKTSANSMRVTYDFGFS